MDIDEIDKRIINILLEDARLSFRQLAKRAGISVATALKRTKILEKEVIITGYHAELDYEPLGYQFEVIINIKVGSGKLAEVEKRIANIPNVLQVFDVTGNYDSMVIARFKTRRELDAFLKKIQQLDFVRKTNTILILQRVKSKKMSL